MKIQYKKKRLKYYSIFGIIWLILGIAAVTFESGTIFNYGYLLMGFLYLGTYFFEKNKQYLTIENGVISKNQLIPKKINLNEIKQIKKFAGEYILKTDSTDLRVNTELIDPKSLLELNTFLQSLNFNSK